MVRREKLVKLKVEKLSDQAEAIQAGLAALLRVVGEISSSEHEGEISSVELSKEEREAAQDRFDGLLVD